MHALSSTRHFVPLDHLALIQTMKLYMLFCIFCFLMVSCVLVQYLCYSSALFVDEKVPHMSSSRSICCHSLCALSSPPLLSSNLRHMSMHISHFLALSSSLSPQTFEFSTSHIIVDFTYCCTALRTRTRTNTNPNGTEASAAGISGNARAMRKQSKCRMIQEGHQRKHHFS